MPQEHLESVGKLPSFLYSIAAALPGIGILIAWTRQIDTRTAILALASGLACCVFIPQFAVPALLYSLPPDAMRWVPPAWMFYSLFGFLSGLLGIFIVTAFLAVGGKLPTLAGNAAERWVGNAGKNGDDK